MEAQNTQVNALNDYLVESLSPQMGYFHRSTKVLHKETTLFQELEIHETAMFGRILRLDGVFQTSEKDEFLYHEPLSHVAGIAMNGPKKALVIGGGDGGAAEEFLKYPTIEKVVMVELDQGVVDTCIKYIPSISNGAFDHHKMDLRIEDGVKYIENATEKFDIVMLDLTDPMGPSAALYTKEFYTSIANILTPNGAMTLHIESPITRPREFSGLYWTLKSVFKNVRPMLNYVPMYGTLWGYAVASQGLDPLAISEEEIQKRLNDFNMPDLKFYNAKTHFSLMTLPTYIQEILKEEKPAYTLASSPDVAGQLDHKLCIARRD